jgi:UPF0755 protein
LKRTLSIAVFLLAASLAAGALYQRLQDYAAESADPAGAETFFAVAPGERLKTTADRLHREGIVRRPVAFRVLARLRGVENRIRAGEYRLSPAMTPEQVLQRLVKGEHALHRLTVPEGLTLDQVAERVQAAGLGDAGAFARTASDPALSRRLGVEATTLEGYLFPETYFFPRPVSAEAICRAMVRRFRAVFNEEWKERAEAMGHTVHEIVTLASIVEKETGDPGERPLIASVFHNRLKRGMRLQTDPTVIYGIENFDGNLTRRDLKTHSPYNTYTIDGLPPGPIANPGRASLEAALYPAESDYLYFVSRNDGTHVFSATYPAHRQAVRRYQGGG